MDIKLSYIFFCLGTILGVAQNDSLSTPFFKFYDEKVTSSLYFIDTSNSFEFLFDFGGENKDNSGSKLFTISTRFYHKKWMQSLTFINQKGFYVEDDVTVFLPRLRTTKIGGTTSYVFNDKFSFKTIANQKEWQIKSAGSFIPNFSFYYTNFDLNNGSGGEHSDVYLATLSPLYEVTGSFKIGYNVDSFFSFINLNFTDFVQDTDAKIRLNDNFSTFKFTLGYRFNPPKKVKELYEKVNKKMKLKKSTNSI